MRGTDSHVFFCQVSPERLTRPFVKDTSLSLATHPGYHLFVRTQRDIAHSFDRPSSSVTPITPLDSITVSRITVVQLHTRRRYTSTPLHDQFTKRTRMTR